MAEALAQCRPEFRIAAQRRDQAAGLGQFRDTEEVPSVRHVLGETLQRAEVARRVDLPAVVEVHADGRDEAGAGILEVLLRLAEEELDEAPAGRVDGLLLLDVVLPGPGHGVVVDHLVRVLQPTQERLSPLAVGARVEFAGRQFLFGEAAVSAGGGRLDPSTNAQVAQVAVGDPEDVEVLRGIAGEFQTGTRLQLAQALGWIEIA